MLLGIWASGTIWQNMFLAWMMGMKISSVCWVTQQPVVMEAVMVLSSGRFFQFVPIRSLLCVIVSFSLFDFTFIHNFMFSLTVWWSSDICWASSAVFSYRTCSTGTTYLWYYIVQHFIKFAVTSCTPIGWSYDAIWSNQYECIIVQFLMFTCNVP